MTTDEHSPTEPEQGTPKPSSGSKERALIRAALQQADKRTGVGPAPVGVDSVVPGHEIIREIHRGGQGVVYLAVQASTKRKVAVKVLYDSAVGGSSGHARFEREVQILARLNHPNIVKVHDSGTTPAGSVYYVMEYISGEPLDSYIASKPGLAVESAMRLFMGVCAGIEAAHLRGVIHRDLKPANILVNEEGQAVVVDFGLAKLSAGEQDDEESMRAMTMTGQFVGSLPWASPEQAQGSPDAIDVRTDVYSLGVILYQMLTGGRFPYEVVGKMMDVLEHILHTAPARPSTLRRQINDEVETIVLKSLNKERARRYQSAGELKRDIERYLGGEPIEAKRDSAIYVLAKTAKKYRKTVAVAGSFVVLLAVFAVVMSIMAATQSRLRIQAEGARQAEVTARAEAESQRDIATHNLGQMRAFTGMLVYDLYDELADTRGTSEVRRRMIEGASEYLQSVRAESSDDPTFQIEVADVSMRAGDLLGGRDAQKLGDTDQARLLYERALSISRARADANPDSAEARLALGESLTRMAWLAANDRRFADAISLHEQARGQFRDADRLAGADDELADRTRRALAEADRVVALVLHAYALGEDDAGLQSRVIDTAIDLASGAVDVWRLRSVGGDTGVERSWAKALTTLAGARVTASRRFMQESIRLSASGDDAGASDAISRALDGFEDAEDTARRAVELWEPVARDSTLASDRAGYADALHGAGLARMWRAAARGRIGEDAIDDHRAALAWYQQGLEVARQAVDEDPMSVSARRQLVVLLSKCARQLEAIGELEAAERFGLESIEVREAVALADPTARHRSDLALGQYRFGLFLEHRSDEVLGDPKADLRARAADLYELALAGYQALPGTERPQRIVSDALARVRETP